MLTSGGDDEVSSATQRLFGSGFPLLEAYETTVRQIPALKLPAHVQFAMDWGRGVALPAFPAALRSNPVFRRITK